MKLFQIQLKIKLVPKNYTKRSRGRFVCSTIYDSDRNTKRTTSRVDTWLHQSDQRHQQLNVDDASYLWIFGGKLLQISEWTINK